MPPPRRLFAGHQLRELRRTHALSQAQAAARLGISTSYLSQIENGDRPLTELVLAALARARFRRTGARSARMPPSPPRR